MANTRRELKPYKGYSIIKINGYRYIASKTGEQLEANSLQDIKKRIDAKINVKKLSRKLGEILLPKIGV